MNNKANGLCRLLGDRDGALFANGDRVRGRALVRETVQRERAGLQRRGKFSASSFSRSQTPSMRKGHVASVRSHF